LEDSKKKEIEKRGWKVTEVDEFLERTAEDFEESKRDKKSKNNQT